MPSATETPTQFIRRVNRESGIGSCNEISDKVDRELSMFGSALDKLTGGRPAQERIRELREQEETYSILVNYQIALKRTERLLGQLLIYTIAYQPL